MEIIIVNRGSGTLTYLDESDRAPLRVGVGPVAALAADLNLDGSLDLATANMDSKDVSVLLNDGTGSFTEAVDYALFSSPRTIGAIEANRLKEFCDSLLVIFISGVPY